MKKIVAWMLGVINDRIDCPNCGGFRTGILLGEWGDEMRECSACKHYWTLPYDIPDELLGMGLWRYYAGKQKATELELDSILKRKPNGGLE